MKDFRDEIPGYLNNEAIRKTLEDLPLKSGVGSIGDNMLLAYKALVDLQVVDTAEMPLLQAWINDLAGIGIL